MGKNKSIRSAAGKTALTEKPKNGRFWVAAIYGGPREAARSIRDKLHGTERKSGLGIVASYHVRMTDNVNKFGTIPEEVDIVIALWDVISHDQWDKLKAAVASRDDVMYVRTGRSWARMSNALRQRGFKAVKLPLEVLSTVCFWDNPEKAFEKAEEAASRPPKAVEGLAADLPRGVKRQATPGVFKREVPEPEVKPEPVAEPVAEPKVKPEPEELDGFWLAVERMRELAEEGDMSLLAAIRYLQESMGKAGISAVLISEGDVTLTTK